MVELVGPLIDPERHGGNAEDAFDVVCSATIWMRSERQSGWESVVAAVG